MGILYCIDELRLSVYSDDLLHSAKLYIIQHHRRTSRRTTEFTSSTTNEPMMTEYIDFSFTDH